MEKVYQSSVPDTFLERVGSVLVVSVEKHTDKATGNTYSCYCEKYDRWNTAVKYKTYIAAKQKGKWSGARWGSASSGPVEIGVWYGHVKPLCVVATPNTSNKNLKGFLCECSCGEKITRSSSSIRSMNSSCGHNSVNKHAVHKQLQSAHRSMHQRCNNTNNMNYRDYGGRGIKVCSTWADYFAFERWAVSNGFEPGLTIDRIDNNAGYSPDNCRWVTRKAQSENRRSTAIVPGTSECRRQVATRMSQETGIPARTIEERLKRGASLEDAISTVGVCIFGEIKKLTEWAKDPRCVVSYCVLSARIKRGAEPEQALTVPSSRRVVSSL